MRVLMLTDCYPPHTGGGVEKVVSELVRGLLARGHVVRVLTLLTRTAAAFEVDGDFSIRRLPAVDLTGLIGVQFVLPYGLLRGVRREVQEFKPDVIHAHNLFFRTTEAVALLHRFFRVPLVTTLHLGALEGDERLLGLLVRLYEATLGRYVMRVSNAVTAVSAAVAEHGGQVSGARHRIQVIPNGVDTQVFQPGQFPEPPEIIFVGRLVPNKGPLTMIRAAAAVNQRYPEARFTLVGDGPQRQRLEREAARLGIAGAVRFTGVRDDIPKMLRQSTLFVRPSTLEGLPLTVLEAMACGLPVVATPVGGTPEVVRDGEQGLLVPVADAAALAEAILKLLDDPAAAAEMGRRGRETVLHGYGWENVVARTEEVYREVIGG
jgi:glycosyltransferase involved in cell wall biosynthesis